MPPREAKARIRNNHLSDKPEWQIFHIIPCNSTIQSENQFKVFLCSVVVPGCKGGKAIPIIIIFSLLLRIKDKGIAHNGSIILQREFLQKIVEINILCLLFELNLENGKEIDDYQKIIDGARMVVENWRARVEVEADWPLFELGSLCKMMTGGTPRSTIKEYYEKGNIRWLVSGVIQNEEIFECEGRITRAGMENSKAKYLPVNSVLIALNRQGKTRGTVALLRTEATCNQSLVAIEPNNMDILKPEFLYLVLKSKYQEIRNLTGDNQRSGLNMPILRRILIPLPDVSSQHLIGDQIFSGKKSVDANRELIEVYLKRIAERLGRVLM